MPSSFFFHLSSVCISDSEYQPTETLFFFRSTSVYVFSNVLTNSSWAGSMYMMIYPFLFDLEIMREPWLLYSDGKRFLVEASALILQSHGQVIPLFPLFVEPSRDLEAHPCFQFTQAPQLRLERCFGLLVLGFLILQ